MNLGDGKFSFLEEIDTKMYIRKLTNINKKQHFSFHFFWPLQNKTHKNKQHQSKQKLITNKTGTKSTKRQNMETQTHKQRSTNPLTSRQHDMRFGPSILRDRTVHIYERRGPFNRAEWTVPISHHGDVTLENLRAKQRPLNLCLVSKLQPESDQHHCWLT